MRQALKLHPDSRATAATSVAVEVVRPRSGVWRLHYFVTGSIGELRLPAVTARTRADELWRHTCFEAFVAASPGPSYYELNLAPSTQWAAYRFDAYRSGMMVASAMRPPRVTAHLSAQGYELHASLQVDYLPELASAAVWRIGLAAVIEEANGGLSYWALAHPPGKADFHHADGRVHELGIAE